MKQKIYSTIFLTVFFSLVGVSAVSADTISTLGSEETSLDSNTADQASLTLIYNDTVVFQDVANVTAQAFSYYLADGTTVTATTTGNDALSLLLSADQSSNIFEVTQIKQFSFGSYVACIDIQGEEACEDWQYLVNGAYSFSSIDQQLVENNDELLMYFGSQYVISVNNSEEVRVTDDIHAIIQEYNPQTPGYQPLPNATLGLLESQYATSALDTATSDENGTVTFTAPATSGIYYIGYNQGGYFWPTQEVTVHPIPTQDVILRVETPSSTLYAGTIAMPESCSVIDTTTTTPHTFDAFNAICALHEAKNAGLLSSYQVTDWGFAFAIDQINDVANASDWSQTWLVYHNGEDPNGGINTFSLNPGDELLLTYGPWPMSPLVLEVATTTISINTTSTISVTTFGTSTPLSNTTTLHIGDETLISSDGIFSWIPSRTGTIDIYAESDGFTRTAILPFIVVAENSGTTIEDEAPTSSGGGGCGSCDSNVTSDVNTVIKNIITFLDANQNPDGSFSSSVSFSDWTALAYNAYTGSATGKEKLNTYLLTNPNPIDGPNETTGYARRAMALMSYGINPYSGTDTNYIEKILDGFDGTQFGVEGLINDDVFALIPLLKAGYTASDPIVVSTTKYILEKQDTTGKFESPDITGATLQVLSQLTAIEGVRDAIEKAKNYVLQNQQHDGSFGDVYGTPWMMQGLTATGENVANIKKNELSAIAYIASQQKDDGSIGEKTNTLRIWTSAWAVPALLEKSWSTLLTSFTIPQTQTSGNATNNDDITTSTIEHVLDTTTSTEYIAEAEKAIPETTVLTVETDTPYTPILYTESHADENKQGEHVAGLKITTVPSVSKGEHMDNSEETSPQEQQTETPPTIVSTKEEKQLPQPSHIAFGTTILLGLTLGWRFLRTLV